jgi:hypothetical protein
MSTLCGTVRSSFLNLLAVNVINCWFIICDMQPVWTATDTDLKDPQQLQTACMLGIRYIESTFVRLVA